MYRFYNANAKNRFIDDCTIRAISLSEDKTWNETYQKLSSLAMNKGLMMDSAEFIDDYLDNKYNRVCYPGISVGEFVKKNNTGTYLITMPNHITIAIDGLIYDTFDCSDRVMKCAWKVK